VVRRLARWNGFSSSHIHKYGTEGLGTIVCHYYQYLQNNSQQFRESVSCKKRWHMSLCTLGPAPEMGTGQSTLRTIPIRLVTTPSLGSGERSEDSCLQFPTVIQPRIAVPWIPKIVDPHRNHYALHHTQNQRPQ